MKNEQKLNKKSTKEEIHLKKREEIEKELGVQRNNKNKNKGPNLSSMKMNQLNYYNEIAKNNIHYLMNNPTLKDIIRITSNESVFDQLQSKEQSKDLSKFLDSFPLKRVERINFKYLEIGQIRRDLGLLKKSNVNVKPNYNKDKCKQFAENLFEKRKREGSVKYIPVITFNNINLYNQKTRNNTHQSYKHSNNQKNGLASSNDATWFKKYKHNTHCPIKKHNIKKDDNENIKTEKEIDNLVSARIQVNKYKKYFGMEDNNLLTEQKNKDINDNNQKSSRADNNKNNLVINTLYNNYNNNIITNQFKNFNEPDDNQVPKRTLTTKFPNKFKLNQNDYENNNKIPSEKKSFVHNCFSSNDIFCDIAPGAKMESNQNNVKASFAKNFELGEIKVRKKEEIINNKESNGKKKLKRKDPSYHSQTKLKTKGLITS